MLTLRSLLTRGLVGRVLLVLLFFISFMAIGQALSLTQNTALVVEIVVSDKETFEVFWKKGDQHYSLDRAIRTRVVPERTTYRIPLPGYTRYDSLRIDPVDRQTTVTIRSLKYQLAGRSAVVLDQKEAYEAALKWQSEVKITAASSGNGVILAAENNDPQLIFPTDTLPLKVRGYGVLLLLAALASLAMATILDWAQRQFFDRSPLINGRKWCYLGIGCVVATGYLVLVIPIALPQEAVLFTWFGYTIVMASWLYIITGYLISKPANSGTPPKVGATAWIIYALPALFVFSIYLLAFWPASLSPDSLDQWKQIQKFSFKDWHPVTHTLTLWLVTRVWVSPTMAAFLQIGILAFSCGWVLYRLGKLGVPRLLLWATSLLFAFLPVNGLMAVTIWKDIPYSVSMMIFSVLLLEVALSAGKWLESRKNSSLLIVVLLCVSLYRHNGIFPAFFTPLVCMLLFPRQWKQLTSILLITLMCHLFVRGPVYSWLDVDRNNPLSHIATKMENKFKRVLGQILTTDPSPKKPEEAKEISEQAGPMEIGEKIEQAVAVRLDSSSLLWRIQPLQGHYKRIDYVNLWDVRKNDERKIRYVSGNGFDLRESPKMPMMTEWLFWLFQESKEHSLLFLMWRPAFFFYLLVFGVVVASLRHRRAVFVLLLPLLFNSLPVLFFISKSSIYRYHYSVVLTALVLALPLLLATFPQPDETER